MDGQEELWLDPAHIWEWKLGKGLSLVLGLSGRARSAEAVHTWGLARAPQLCHDLPAGGAQAGRLGAACFEEPGGAQLDSIVSLEPHPSALHNKG